MKEYESVKLKENKRFLYFSNGIDKNGDIIGFTGGTAGSIWVDNSNYLHWLNSSGVDYRAKWRINQFESSFENGAGFNPNPGSSYAGALWVDNEFGWTHLAYIGADGSKYLVGSGDYPYTYP